MSNAGLLSLSGSPVEEEDEDARDDEEDEGPEFEEDAEPQSGASVEDESDHTDEDPDPAELLRELGGPRSARPRSGRVTSAEQRIRLRSR
jgi:hypothetical protein